LQAYSTSVFEDPSRPAAAAWSGGTRSEPGASKERRRAIVAREGVASIKGDEARAPRRFNPRLTPGRHAPAGEHYLGSSSFECGSDPEQRKLILGGARCACGPEQINERTIDSPIWPRIAAIAERFLVARAAGETSTICTGELTRPEGLGLRHHLAGGRWTERAGTGKTSTPLRAFASVLSSRSASAIDITTSRRRVAAASALDRFRWTRFARTAFGPASSSGAYASAFLRDPERNSVERDRRRWRILRAVRRSPHRRSRVR